MADLKTLELKTKIFIAWFGVLATIVGAGWAINQYYQRLSENRVEKTIELAKE